ncbi:hypothetical protein Tco_0978398 [Tanacetum coccineum]|uniref:Uncharacterized protein n=1 Tax=Tanacetum coccineum TaxID=301880 RepID=A0ABQ5EMW2_9ASTR
MTLGTLNSRLVPNPIPQPPYVPPTKKDCDILFQPMFDEFFNPPPSVISPVPVAFAPRPIDPTSVEESPKTPHFHDDPLHETLLEDSTSQGSSSNVRSSHTPLELLGKWTKNNPFANVIGDPSRSVSTRKQVKTNAMWCYFEAFLTLVETKDISKLQDILRVTAAQLQLLSDYFCWKDYADREGIKIDWRTRILTKIRFNTSRECKDQETGLREPVKRNVTVETTETKALVAQDGLGSSSSDSEVLIKKVRDNALTELRNKFEKAEKERVNLKLTLEKFGNSSKNLSKLLEIQVSGKFKTGVGFDSQVVDSQVFDSQENARYKTSEGYHTIPPPYIGNFMHPKYDLVLADEEEYVFSESVTSIPNVTTSKAKTSMSKPKSVVEPLIEDWISNSEDDNETEFKSEQRKPSFAKIEFLKSNEHVKTPRDSIKKIMDKCKIGLGYNAIPPPYIENFIPPKHDLVYPSLDDFVEVNEYASESVVKKPTVETNEPKTTRKEDGALIIEDWVSESEEEDVPKIKTVEMFNKPSFAKINFVKFTKQVKSPRNTSVDKNRQNIPNPRGNKRNWNQHMS